MSILQIVLCDEKYFFTKHHDGKKHTYTGVAIQEILEKAGVTTGSQLRKENFSKYLIVKCADGYKVLFSLPKLDSSFTDRKMIPADTSDGRLCLRILDLFAVVPDEKKGAR